MKATAIMTGAVGTTKRTRREAAPIPRISATRGRDEARGPSLAVPEADSAV